MLEVHRGDPHEEFLALQMRKPCRLQPRFERLTIDLLFQCGEDTDPVIQYGSCRRNECHFYLSLLVSCLFQPVAVHTFRILVTKKSKRQKQKSLPPKQARRDGLCVPEFSPVNTRCKQVTGRGTVQCMAECGTAGSRENS